MQDIERQTGNSRNIWSPSSLETFMSCPYKFKLSGIDGWSRAGSGEATGFGTLIHEAIELRDRLRFHKRWNDRTYHLLIKKYLKKSESFTETREYDIYSFIRALIFYFEKYEDEPFETVTLPDGRPALEVTFEYPLPGQPGKLITGIIDRIVRDINTGGVWLMDHKSTKSSLGSHYFGYYRPNTQISAYMWAMQKMLGEEVRGFIVDGIQTQVQNTNLARYPVAVGSDQLQEWEDAIKYYVDQAQAFAEADFWPQNFSACGNKGGCQFREICAHRPSMRESLLKTVDYERRS